MHATYRRKSFEALYKRHNLALSLSHSLILSYTPSLSLSPSLPLSLSPSLPLSYVLCVLSPRLRRDIHAGLCQRHSHVMLKVRRHSDRIAETLASAHLQHKVARKAQRWRWLQRS